MENRYPIPGDLILVEQSEWYALKSGELLRVCEKPGWAITGRDIYVVPRSNANSFWGPDCGPPDGKKREKLSTSGGPFLTATLLLLPPLEFIEKRNDTFWCWKEWPLAGGGMDYEREVSVWKLSILPDPAWLDPDLAQTFRPGVHPPGPIRLACASCERDDCDGIYAIPPNWTEVQFVQTLKQSKAEIPLVDSERRSLTEWYTHLGVCPECALAECEDSEEGLP